MLGLPVSNGLIRFQPQALKRLLNKRYQNSVCLSKLNTFISHRILNPQVELIFVFINLIIFYKY